MRFLVLSAVLAFCVSGVCLAQDIGQPSQGDDASQLSEEDRLLVAVQQICPVTGEKLGSMGEPVQVSLEGQTVFLCCEGCRSKKISASHWKTVLGNFAKAQGTCPVMKKPVDASSESIVVNGKRIFVCCPPCIDKIQANAESFTSGLMTKYQARVAAAESDGLHIAAQKICPVTGNELGSMGQPVKVKVGQNEHAFLCCNGCVGKQIKAEHWKTVLTNLVQAQGTCPVMGGEIDTDSDWTAVSGRRILVCCPPCKDKIHAKPEQHVATLNEQIRSNLAVKQDK